MRGYNGDENLDEYEDWDEYEDDGASEDECEREEEVHQPTQEELSYLKLRERLKERVRRESGTNLSSSNKLTSTSSKNGFGSFFGPSQPVIAQRVIQESKSMLENPELAARVFQSSSVRNKSSSSAAVSSSSAAVSSSSAAVGSNSRVSSSSAAVGSNPRVNSSISKSANGSQKKSQILKNTRDYSFLLSDDAELPVPKDQTVKNVRPPRSDAQLAKVMPQKTRELQYENRKKVSDVHEERKQKPLGGHGQSRVHTGQERRAHTQKLAHTGQERAHTQKFAHTGQERAPTQKLAPVPRPNQSSTSTKNPMYKVNGPSLEKTVRSKIPSVPAGKTDIPHIRKPMNMQAQPSFSQRHVVQKTKHQESNMVKKQAVSSSKSQQMKPPQSSNSSGSGNAHMKRKPRRDEPGPQDISSMIRNIMGYNPDSKKFKERDAIDDRQMEVGFDDVMKEEKRSARVAREEDEEEWRKIQEEEELERRRKAKKRKLSQH